MPPLRPPSRTGQTQSTARASRQKEEEEEVQPQKKFQFGVELCEQHLRDACYRGRDGGGGESKG
jgi:hypothetical protein